MKTVGKKDITHGKNIMTMFMVYLVILLVVVVFLIAYKANWLFYSTVIALSMLCLERLIALIKFKRLPTDLVVMHRDSIEIKDNKVHKIIKYKDIVDIEVSSRTNKFYISTTFTPKIFVRYVDNPLAV